MKNGQQLAVIYDTIESIPGMDTAVKIELRIPRKSAFLLAKVIERGLAPKDSENMLDDLPEGALSPLAVIPEELLKKAELIALNEKLKALR